MTRFTPVHTGNSAFGKFSQTVWAVYPCVYREHVIIGWYLCIQIGLSLCVQRTLNRSSFSPYASRFIPVYTGNTPWPDAVIILPPVYPCVYREHHWINLVRNWQCGLSLCIQGTPEPPLTPTYIVRFIPVYTGNTLIITYCFIIKILTVKFLPIF